MNNLRLGRGCLTESVTIRRLGESELPSLRQIQADRFDHCWSEAQLTAYLNNPRALFLGLWQNHTLAGYALFTTVLDEAELQQIAIAEQQQGQGLAGQLLEAGHRQLTEQGIVRTLLEVRSSNLSALALYRRAGFQQDGLRKGYYPSPTGREDAVLMSCDISAMTL